MFLSRTVFNKLASTHYLRTGEGYEYAGYLIYYFENKLSRRKKAKFRELLMSRREVKSTYIPWEIYEEDEAYEELMAIVAASKESEPCDACKEIDGHSFPANEVPQEPHPNCQCEITIVQEDGTTTQGEPLPYEPPKEAQKGQVRQDGCARITSGTGLREDPQEGDIRQHDGIDIAAPQGTDIHSPVEGEVIRSGYHAGYGYFTEVRLEDGTSALFGHMAGPPEFNVGDRVEYHDVIGQIGSTGKSSGPHLHYERRDSNNKPGKPDADEIEDLLDSLDDECSSSDEHEANEEYDD